MGSGAAGCATALTLIDRGVGDIVVIDMQQHPRARIGESVPPASRAVLQRLGVWQAFHAQGHLLSAGSCASWGHPELRYNDFLLGMQGQGWHLDRTAFDEMLCEAVGARGGTIVRGLRLRSAERSDAGDYALSLEAENGASTRVTAGFLVDATGIAASVARRLGVARNQVDCLAVIGAVFDLKAPDAVPSQALLEACADGWWYAAKIPGHRLIAALAVEPSQHRRFADPDTWRPALHATQHVARWLDHGKAVPAGTLELETALAPSAILSRVVGERWLAVGDAASAYDPISAQGILKALCDGEAAADAIAGCLAGAGQTPLLAYQDGVFARFRDYLRLRRHLYQRERRWPLSPFWHNRLLHP
ncbi:FAD-dependent monooxygenase [Acidisphaera sp. S103]|uniref:FAD-dependent monooxygenase n=1 Tax=Acidisphaera sp. S103 TaxID=1747223 RepID=UPI001C208DD9|nr:FAD-dependent monooxygenase [Acidisphaera sp. S103]